jgi:ankyrin repeat protein
MNEVERLPLCIASEGGSGRILELLLDSKADVRRKEGEGRTALHCAVMFADRPRGIQVVSVASSDDEEGVRSSWLSASFSSDDR